MNELLPTPTETELRMTGKSDYFLRLMPMQLDKIYKIDQFELTGWISANFNSIFLYNKAITLKEYKKYAR